MDSLSIESLKPTELPAPPQSAIRVVHACSQPDFHAEELGEIISHDPILSAELLRVANSAYFGFANEVSSVARAVTVIGQRALRNLVLCIAMRDALRQDQLPAFPIDEFWEASLRRAVCARCLASVVGLDADECFTAGLLQDFGLLVLMYVMHHRISEWPELAQMSPDERYEHELGLFHTSHDKVGLQLAQAWDLPRELRFAMGAHHDLPPQGEGEEIRGLCHVAECADWMAAVFTIEDRRLAVQECRALLADRFQLSSDRCDELLEQVSAQIQQAAQAFGFEVGEQVSFDTVVREANLRLVEENLSFQEINWQLEQVLQERDRVAADLHRELELAREVQRSLLPGESADDLGIVGLNVSAKEVSGDFYDFFPLHTGKVAFCIADVAGKGMNAALLMAKVSSLFRCLGKGIHDPAKLLGMLNREIYETSIRGMFVTMTAGVFDPQTRAIRLANAGHLPALQTDSGRVTQEYPATAPPLGVAPDTEFDNVEISLGEQRLYLYTDGLLEARIGAHRRLEQDGLERLLQKFENSAPVERLQEIVASVRRGPAGIEDDLTVLVIGG